LASVWDSRLRPEFGRRQVDPARAAADLVGVLVEGEVRERQDRLDRHRAGQEDHRHPVPVAAQPADDLEPVDVGQQDVQDEQVEGAVAGQPERVGAVLRGGHLEPEEAQRGGDGLPQEELVVHHEQGPVVGCHHVSPAYGGERCVREIFEFRVNAAGPWLTRNSHADRAAS